MTPPADPAPDALAAAVERVRKLPSERHYRTDRWVSCVEMNFHDRDLLCDGIDRLRAEAEAWDATCVQLRKERDESRARADALAAEVAGLRSELAETRRQLEVSCTRDSLRLTAAEAEVTGLREACRTLLDAKDHDTVVYAEELMREALASAPARPPA